jgi:hypothetical protein
VHRLYRVLVVSQSGYFTWKNRSARAFSELIESAGIPLLGWS